MFPRFAFAFVFVIAALLACMPAAQATLPESISQMLAAAQIPEDAVGIVVMRGNTTVLAHDAERGMQPASTMKVLTTMAALDVLGPIFRGRTELRSAATVLKGTLQGDLILRGGADVDFNSEVLEHMLQTLRNQGIRKIDGRLVLDRQLFSPARPDLDTPQFDEAPQARYNVIPDALLLNMNLLQIDLRSSDRRLQLVSLPALEGITISSQLQLINGDCDHWERGWQAPEYVRDRRGAANSHLTVILHGTFPKNCARVASLNLLDRQDYLDRAFRAAWTRLGGTLRGPTVEAATPAATVILAEHAARALPEVIRDTNKISDNTLARTVFLSLGSLESDPILGSRPSAMPGAANAPDSTAMRADMVIRNWMHAHGIDENGLVLENGSGLSRTERISAAQMAGVLQAARHSNWAPEFESSLPIAALDGTMRHRLQGSAAASRARLKTGALKDVVAIAGYVPDASGEQCVVVVMINHERVGGGAGRAILDALVDWVAHSGAGGTVLH